MADETSDEEDEKDHQELYEGVVDALYAVANEFDSEVNIEGVEATDIFGLNEILASSVETQVVRSLNSMRDVWDENDEYRQYEFVRQSQTFPDTVLIDQSNPTDDPLIGIELKSWYLLAKEGEPSFRYQTTMDAIAEQDLLVIFPWSLSNVVSGEPEIYTPFVISAQYASAYADYYWKKLRDFDEDTNTDISHPEGVSPYPDPKTEIADKPAEDSGDNYGRLARSKMKPMNNYIDRMMARDLLGIPAEDWVEFFEGFTDGEEPAGLSDLEGIGDKIADRLQEAGFETVDDVQEATVEELVDVEGIGKSRAKNLVD